MFPHTAQIYFEKMRKPRPICSSAAQTNHASQWKRSTFKSVSEIGALNN